MNKSLITAVALATVFTCGYASAHENHGAHHHGFPPLTEFDADRDGALNSSELKAFSQNLSEKADRHQKSLVTFEKADADGNGFVTLDELAVVIPKPEQPKADAGNRAKADDRTKADGKAEKADRRQKVNSAHHRGHHKSHGKHGFHHGPGSFDQHQPNPVIFVLHHFDTNGDYKLDKSEYAKFIEAESGRVAMEKQLAKAVLGADLNKDGLVIPPEFDAVSHHIFLQNAPAYQPKAAPQPESADDADDGQEEDFE
ncbi:hypothetical protein [Ruminobacter sp. RM87]|uniref:hypothetical protein n=1 Tax=Ruminobacter sp. RM87 TaxID=1200567 RepID=UPI0004E2632A|nr:hypothetical protein [Ruminobacter sp. RM87]